MTRETKIGLLVGLAFIIVVGILLSDYLRSTGQPPQAALSSAANAVRDAINSPGTSNPPITIVAPHDAPPQQPVPTRDELNPAPSPVIPVEPAPAQQDTQANPVQSQPDQTVTSTPAAPDNNNDSLSDAAKRRGEQLVPSNPDGTPTSPQDDSQDSPSPTGQMQSYVAQSGDSVSRMAARLMGGNTKANRQAIIDANSSLQDDPDQVVAGQTYNIPVKGQAVAQAPSAPATPASPDTSSGNTYTVQAGDSLWSIANDELGDPGLIDQIKDLNQDILKGKDHDVLYPGMKLHLPAKSSNG
jgi:nucleoid-associated protein YgaU